MKHFQLPMTLFILLCMNVITRAQTSLNYPDQTTKCAGTANILIKIGYVQSTGKLQLKVGADAMDSVIKKKEDAEKFLLEQTRRLLQKNCSELSHIYYDAGVAALARDAANYIFNDKIVVKDSMKLASDKELRLYSTRGNYFLSVVNPLTGTGSDLLKKSGSGEYAFDVANVGREKLIVDRIVELLGKHLKELKAPKIYLLPDNRLYIRNPAAVNTDIKYDEKADADYLKKIKGEKVDTTELAGTNQPEMFHIKTETPKKPDSAKSESEKPSVAKEVLLKEESIRCNADSSFSLAAFTHPQSPGDSFKIRIFTKKKIAKDTLFSMQVTEAEFFFYIERNYDSGCTDADVRKNVAKFLKEVKEKLEEKAKNEKEKEAWKQTTKALSDNISTLAGEEEDAAVLQVRKSFPIKVVINPLDTCKESCKSDTTKKARRKCKRRCKEKFKHKGNISMQLPDKTVWVDSIHLVVMHNSIYEVAIVGRVDSQPIKTILNNQYGLSLLALIDKGQSNNVLLNDTLYSVEFSDLFFVRPSHSGGISKELRDGEYTFKPNVPNESILPLKQKRLLDYISASAFVDLQAFNADNPNKNIATELYFNYHINPYNMKRNWGFLKNAYLPINLGFNLFKQGESMPTYRKPATREPDNPASDTISYQYYFKNLDLYKYAFMQVRPMLNIWSYDMKKGRLLFDLNGGFLLMGSNAQINDPAKGVDSSYSKPVYSYSWLLESRFRFAPRPRYGFDLHVMYSFGLRPFSLDMKSATGEYTIQEMGKANLLNCNKDDFIIGELNFYFNPKKQKSDTDKGGLYFKLNWYKSTHYPDGHFMFLVGYSTDIKNFFR